MKKTLILISFVLLSFLGKAQFFVEYNTGYNLSLNRFEKFQTNSPFNQGNLVNMDPIPIFLTHGEGIFNELSIGYKSQGLLYLKISTGCNINSMNFRNLNTQNSFNYYNEPYSYTATSIEDPMIGLYYEQFFDEYMTIEKEIITSIQYNIYYINPEIGVSKSWNKSEISLSYGFSFNYINASFTNDNIQRWNSKSASGYSSYFRTMTATKQKPIVSSTVGILYSYSMASNITLNFNIKYRPLKYTPIMYTVTDYKLETCENDVIIFEDTEFDTLEEYYFSESTQNITYNFSTLSVSIGLRYFFNKPKLEEKGGVYESK